MTLSLFLHGTYLHCFEFYYLYGVKLELYWDNENGGTYDGEIAAISYKNETQSTATDRKTYKVWASFTPDERIRLGMTMVVYPVTAPEAEPEKTTDEE